MEISINPFWKRIPYALFFFFPQESVLHRKFNTPILAEKRWFFFLFCMKEYYTDISMYPFWLEMFDTV